MTIYKKREVIMRKVCFLFICFLIFVIGVVGYAIYDTVKNQGYVGSSVVVNGDTLRIVEWKLYDIYVLENGLVYRLNQK